MQVAQTQRTASTSLFGGFTGGKLPELAIFFNVAFFRTAGVVNHFLGNKYENDKDALEKIFTDWVKAEKNQLCHKPESQKVYAGLRNYLWKGFKDNQNSSGHIVTLTEQQIMLEMLDKLIEIRNFHSHIYHDNIVLKFSDFLKKEILSRHYEAADALMQTHGHELKEYGEDFIDKPFFNTQKREFADFITREGRIFFLSFFLTKTEMERLMSQSKGYKRADTKAFKVKRLVHTHFTHRDGAARQHYGHSDTAVEAMNEADKKDVFSARQAFKIISYLNDAPPECHDKKLFPIFLQDKKVETNEEYIAFCRQNALFNSLDIKTLVKKVEIKSKDKETITEIKTVVKEFIFEINTEGYVFHLGQTSFHQLILDALRVGSDEQVLKRFKEFADERIYFKRLLTDTTFLNAESAENESFMSDILDEYTRYKFRNDKLKDKFDIWRDKISRDKVPNTEGVLQLLDSEPIEVSHYDFFYKDDNKPRAVEMFSRYVVQYFIDFDVIQDDKWEWLFEIHGFVDGEVADKNAPNGKRKGKMLKKINIFSSKIPDQAKCKTQFENENAGKTIDESTITKPRLAVTHDGQVTVRIKREKGKNEKTQQPVYHKFVLGISALKNLLIAHREDKPILNFFDDVTNDLDKISKANGQTIAWSDLALLTPKDVPTAWQVAMKAQTIDDSTLREKAKKRLHIIIEDLEKWTKKDSTLPHLSRADKNRQIMRCYTFFDWVYPNDSKFKFLRKNEYQRLSVYHYLLEKRRNTDLKTGHYADLLINREKGIDILRHTPNEVKGLLQSAVSLDDLLVKTFEKTQKLLESWQSKIGLLQGENLKKILAKLSISTYKNGLPNPEIPFDIQPSLVLRAFYQEQVNTELTTFSLSGKFSKRKDLQKGLRNENYLVENYLNLLDKNQTEQKRAFKYVSGAINEVKVKDTLLWQIAKDYLKRTNASFETLFDWGKREEDWKIQNLRNTVLKLPFFEIEVSGKKLNKLFLSIKYHQLDDYMMVESKKVIESAMKQVLMRLDTDILNNLPTKSHIIPYEEVYKEIQRVQNDAVHWAYFILKWEQNAILKNRSRLTPQYFTALVEKRDKRYFEKKQVQRDKTNEKEHIRFDEICDFEVLTDKLRKKLIETRGKAFHMIIPEGWSFWQRETDPEDADLRTLLGYHKKRGFDYENRQDAD